MVECANLFRSIPDSICIFREKAKSVLLLSENTPKVVNHIGRMRQKSLSLDGDYGNKEWFVNTKSTPNTPKVF